MATGANSIVLASQARRAYVEQLLEGMPVLLQAVDTGARVLLGQVARSGAGAATAAGGR